MSNRIELRSTMPEVFTAGTTGTLRSHPYRSFYQSLTIKKVAAYARPYWAGTAFNAGPD
jgi:hypothetical protein